MTKLFVDKSIAGSLPPKPEKPRCYVVAMYLKGKYCGCFKAVYPGDWDCMEPFARYHYTRDQAIAYFRDGDSIEEQVLRDITDAHMSIYSGDWEYHLDEGLEEVNISAQQMEYIFVDCWDHRDLS